MFVLGRRCYDDDEDKHHRRGNLLNDAIVAHAGKPSCGQIIRGR